MDASGEPLKKRQKSDNEYGIPYFQISLSERWILVITSSGTKFYYDTTAKTSHWQLEDAFVDELRLRDTNKDKILLLIGMLRGNSVKSELLYQLGEFVHGGDFQPQESGVESEEGEKNGENGEVLSELEEEEDSPQIDDLNTTNGVINEGAGLALGYESSDDESEEEPQAPQAPQAPQETPQSPQEPPQESPEPDYLSEEFSDSEDENGLNLSDLEDLQSSPTGSPTDAANDCSPRDKFFAMLSRHGIDPYSSYELEYPKLMNDPVFFEIEDEKEQAELFNEWCSLSIRRGVAEKPNESDDSDDQDENDFEGDSETRALVDFCNLLKSCNKNFKYYFDFKRKYKKSPSFENLEPDKLREKVFKSYVALRRAQDPVEHVYGCMLKNAELKRAIQNSTSTDPETLWRELCHSDEFNLLQEVPVLNFLDSEQRIETLKKVMEL